MKARRKLPAGQLIANLPAKRDEAVLNAGGTRCESVQYDFSVDGGAVGTINFGRLLPAGAIVVGIIADELANITSGGSATLKLKAGSTDLIAATAIADFAGLTAPALDGSAAAIKIAADAELKMDIAVAALTAGQVRFYVRYLLANDL